MLGSKFFQILLVCFVLCGLFIFSEPGIVFFFGTVGLTLACFTFVRRQDLPSFTNDLSDFGEGEILAFEKLSDFYGSLAVNIT